MLTMSYLRVRYFGNLFPNGTRMFRSVTMLCGTVKGMAMMRPLPRSLRTPLCNPDTVQRE